MAELQQPNIVGNFLAAYSSGLERQQQQQDAAYQRQRQAKADQMTEQKFAFDMDAGQLDMALKRASAMNEILAGVDERNPQTLEVAKQRYMTSFGGRPEDVASITMADIPRIKMQTGQTLKELQIQAQKANIAQSYAAARASDRQGQGGGEGFDGKPPSGYVWGKAADGSVSLVPIKGGPADPALRPLTHDQGLAAGFAERLITADQYFNNPKVSEALRSSKQKAMSGVPLVGNYMTSTEFQQGDQASREFINAQLRRESGAVIGPTEFENAFQQYLPQPGDSPEVLAQKAKSRKIAIYNMLKVAGPQFSERARQYMPQAPTSDTPPIIRSKQEFDALPSGTIFIEADGKRYRKP